MQLAQISGIFWVIRILRLQFANGANFRSECFYE